MINEIKNKLEKYMEAKVPVHLVMRKREGKPPIFYNGFVISKKTDDVFVFQERKLGKTYLLVDDVFSVNVFIEDKERDEKYVDEFFKENIKNNF